MRQFDPDDAYSYLMGMACEEVIPLGVHVDLTYRCDLACSHCYLEDRRRRELTTAEYRELFATLAKQGTLYLLISGGDIFVRRDALDILWSAAEQRFDMTLITHGMNVSEEVARALFEMGVRAVAISVYHTDPPIHDQVTGRVGSFERTMAGVRRLLEHGVEVVLKTPVFDVNAGAEAVMPDFAEALGTRLQMSPQIRGGNDGTDDLLALNMDLDGKANVYACTMGQFDDLAAIARDPEHRTCLAAHASCYIDPSGEVQPCLDYEESAGNIRDVPFETIWRSAPLFTRLRGIRRADFGGCHACENYDFCGLCPAMSARETGDPTGRSPSKCRESGAIRWSFDRKSLDEHAERFDLISRFGLRE